MINQNIMDIITNKLQTIKIITCLQITHYFLQITQIVNILATISLFVIIILRITTIKAIPILKLPTKGSTTILIILLKNRWPKVRLNIQISLQHHILHNSMLKVTIVIQIKIWKILTLQETFSINNLHLYSIHPIKILSIIIIRKIVSSLNKLNLLKSLTTISKFNIIHLIIKC